MSATIIAFPAATPSGDYIDRLGDQISERAVEILAHRQLGTSKGLPSDIGVPLSDQAERLAEMIADRGERNWTPQMQRRVDAVKARLLAAEAGLQVVRFPRSRIVRTKTRQRDIQRAYKHTSPEDAPEERFRRAEFAVQFAADFERRHRR